MKKKIAVIGAGISGICVAQELSKIADVVVFEKSRGYGGRMSTRTVGGYEFDHGAQYFTAKTNEFKYFIESLKKEGVVYIWNPKLVGISRDNPNLFPEIKVNNEFYVPIPKMSSLCRYLASGLDVRLQTRIEKIERHKTKWVLLTDNKKIDEFDWVISAIPSHQAVEIMPEYFSHNQSIRNIKIQGCYALMLGFKNALDIKWDAAKISGYDIAWASINSSKPRRPPGYTVVAHSTNSWAEANIDKPLDDVKNHLLSQLSEILGINPILAEVIDLHRWRYANAPEQNSAHAFIDLDNNIAACGDWCIEGRVEAAFASAYYLVDELKKRLS